MRELPSSGEGGLRSEDDLRTGGDPHSATYPRNEVCRRSASDHRSGTGRSPDHRSPGEACIRRNGAGRSHASSGCRKAEDRTGGRRICLRRVPGA
jgi:hypothetical protein